MSDDLDKVVVIGNNESPEQYLEKRQKETEAKLADPQTGELAKQALVRDLKSTQIVQQVIEESGLHSHINPDVLFSVMKDEPGFSISQHDSGDISCEIDGKRVHASTLVRTFSNRHPNLFAQSYDQVTKAAIKSREDFTDEESKVAFIETYGFERFRDLPAHPEKKLDPDAMTAAEWSKLSLKEKSDFISKYHQSGMETVLSRRGDSADRAAGVKRFGPEPIVNKRAGVVIYPKRDEKQSK